MSVKQMGRRPRVVAMIMAGLAAVAAALGVTVGGAFGASVTSATFSGGVGTVKVGGTLYAKKDALLTLTVVADADTSCIRISDGTTTIDKTTTSSPRTWTFTSADSASLFKAGAGEGVKTITATGFRSSNGRDKCTANQGESGAGSASYVLDNTGPTVSGTLTPAANAGGWNKADVTIAWSATDAGSGVVSVTPSSDSVTANTTKDGSLRTATATDRLGNTGTGSRTVKLDKDVPTLDVTRTPAANASGWNNTDVTLSLKCLDALSGIKACTGDGSYTFDEDGADQSVVAAATDNADNSTSQTVGGVNVDKTAPLLSGAPTSAPAAGGWYTGDVAVEWTASDATSGIDGGAPANSTIGGEGTGLTATQTVKDRAGNSTTAGSAPVKIDRTAPTTSASAADGWSTADVAVTLSPSDALSGVESTRYTVDGGAVQTGTAVSIAGDGVHTLEFWSTDRAGNAEEHKTVEVRIDGTAPSISHTFDKTANAAGWFREDVTVAFVCGDATSGIASCGPDRLVATEAEGQDIEGRAVDHAGNQAVDHALVSLDKTAPVVKASADRAPNDAGWYDDDVVVSFTASDALSGIETEPAAKTLREGEDQSASGTARDAAGNEASDGVSGINVDKTAPVLSGEATTAPNAAGWYKGDVVVRWTASDALSGLAGAAPADSTIGGEGENLSAGATVIDKAGNRAEALVDGIKIDRTAPSTTSRVAEPFASGWYATGVEVTLTATDAVSGVAKTVYTVDGGPEQAYTGPFTHALKGTHTIAFWSVDEAGNVERGAGNVLTLRIDDIAPSITAERTPAANAFGWTNQSVTVSFHCEDTESGLAGCSDPVKLEDEGAGQEVVGNAQDRAGNTADVTVTDINIDKTAPALAGEVTTKPNAAEWHKGDVTVTWVGQDGLSGINAATQPADSTVTGEGADLGAGPVTIEDRAGNVSAPASVSGIKIDRTAPVITGAPTTLPNGNGWYRNAVTVKFDCADALSGCASTLTDETLLGNGADQQVTSRPVEDIAGNATAGKTVGGISIDGLPPQSSVESQCDGANGWCKGQTATVVLTATDQPGLSGVEEIRYVVNGGAEKRAIGASVKVDVPLAEQSGSATVEFHAVDRAGNAEPANAVSLKYDNLAPTVTHTTDPTANAAGWNRSTVNVHFDATDDDGGSGVDASSVTPDVLVSDETPAAGSVIQGFAKDLVGNIGSDSVTVRLDKTAPSVTGAIVSGTKAANGWYTSAVTVQFTCSDALSGVKECPAPVTLTADGADQAVRGTATDAAGNTASATVSGISIDSTRPELAVEGVAPGAIYTLGAVPAATCTATDAISGSVDCKVVTTGGKANGVGTFAYTATATDAAGNTETVTGTYRVIYRWDGFRQPINDTAHQVGTATSVFKAGSTVPAKFQLKKADGSIVQATTAPLWTGAVKGSATTASVDESAYLDAPTAGGLYRFEAADSQYIYNWGSAKTGAGFYHRIGVTLDDGQTYHVNIGLR